MYINLFIHPYQWYDAVNAFFLYSFLGWCMECVVIRREKGFWENRGFARSPFCIIYGFGAMVGYIALRPFSENYLVLYLAGAALATVFEYLVAILMIKLFGTFWWDYSKKPFNYKGIICLESTIGWGVIAVLLFAILQNTIFGIVMRLPELASIFIALVLLAGYSVDFALSARSAFAKKSENPTPVIRRRNG